MRIPTASKTHAFSGTLQDCNHPVEFSLGHVKFFLYKAKVLLDLGRYAMCFLQKKKKKKTYPHSTENGEIASNGVIAQQSAMTAKWITTSGVERK